MDSIKFYSSSSAQVDEVVPPREENVLLNDSVLSNTSFGFSDSLVNCVLGDIQNESDIVNLSDISIREISFNDRDNNGDANHISESNRRPKRQRKETGYCENGDNNKHEFFESEDEFYPAKEKSKIVKENEIPYKRKAGRPKGSKNKQKGCKSKKGKIHNIRPKK